MIRVKIDEDDLLDMLINRVKFWTEDKDTINLFEKMYENYIDGGCFEDMELDIQVIVDNDYVNWCRIIEEDEDDFEEIMKIYKEQGLGDCSCETRICNFIEAISDDEKSILVRY